ncbi:hypothetical protein HY251_11660 [bacterium]|nr:hypothetical protein [bacterium]
MKIRSLAGAFGLATLVFLGLALTRPLEGKPDKGAKDGTGDVSSRSALVPLTDMGKAKYLGFEGGLYPGGNEMPKAHQDEGKKRALAIRPLDKDGRPAKDGKYVLLSIGMSNTTQEFGGGGGRGGPSFMAQARADDAVNKTSLVILDGAKGGKVAASWAQASSPEYDRVRDEVLGKQDLSEKQVEAVWLKLANPGPKFSLPSPQADAYALVRSTGDVIRSMKKRYPNLKQVFLSSRIYAGYATSPLNPEPYAYESGFSVKWVIEAQINQKKTGKIDERAGDLDPDGAGAWLAWGPYLWTEGKNKRSDGLVWEQDDCGKDGTHPSPSGVKKVGGMLLDFFKSSPLTPWFRREAQ